MKKTLTATGISSNSDIKTAAENYFNEQGYDFHQAGLRKSILRSDK